MTSQQLLTADLLDIIFERRNKLYGAYALRKTYSMRLIKALLITIGSSIGLLLFIQPKQHNPVLDNPIIPEAVHPIALPKERKLPPPPPAKPTPPAAAKFITQKIWVDKIKIVANEEVKPEDMPTQTELSTAAIGTANTTGDIGNDAPPIVNNVTNAAKTETAEKPFVAEERSAEFPGGQKAWLAFLSHHLVTPTELQSGEKKTVLVRFLVDTDGTITHFVIVQSAGAAFDNEVIRVLKKMPRWKPAVQNGHKTAVTFTQPVTFIGLED